jgi:serine/threonine-protein kinase RIO1
LVAIETVFKQFFRGHSILDLGFEILDGKEHWVADAARQSEAFSAISNYQSPMPYFAIYVEKELPQPQV